MLFFEIVKFGSVKQPWPFREAALAFGLDKPGKICYIGPSIGE